MLYLNSQQKSDCMASIKAILRKKPNAKGEFPLAIRITKDRKSSFIHTGQYVEQRFWDENQSRVRKSHPNSARLNNLLIQKLAEANDKLLELSTEKTYTSAIAVQQHVKGVLGNRSFFILAKTYLDQLEQEGKHNRVSAEAPMIKHFKEFVKGNILFQEISEGLLKKYQAYLSGTRNVSKRTVINHLVPIRTIFNLAIREGLVDRKFYPFGKGKIVIKFPESVKIGLTQEEVQKLEALELTPGKPTWHARNVWLFCFYLAGMRVSDALRLTWGDIQNDRLFYAMGKNDKAGSLQLPIKAQRILGYYVSDSMSPEQAIFPELRNTD